MRISLGSTMTMISCHATQADAGGERSQEVLGGRHIRVRIPANVNTQIGPS